MRPSGAFATFHPGGSGGSSLAAALAAALAASAAASSSAFLAASAAASKGESAGGTPAAGSPEHGSPATSFVQKHSFPKRRTMVLKNVGKMPFEDDKAFGAETALRARRRAG